MEINYDLIIKYLVKKEPVKEKKPLFSTQKGILDYSFNFPDKFKDLLADKFYRFGITVFDKENNNVSFWTSLLTLLDKNFLIPYNNDEIILVRQFKEQLLDMYNKQELSPFLKEYEKIDLRERFKINPDIVVLQYIVDILDINFIIFDFDTQNISTVYKKDIMNPWKQTILLAQSDVFWEPIMLTKPKGDIQRLFDYNNMCIKKLLTTDITYYNNIKNNKNNNIKKDFMYIDNIYDVVSIEKQSLFGTKKDIDDSDSSVKTDEDDEILSELKNMNKTKLNKMKVGEITDIFKKLKLDNDKTIPTKPIMIDMILAKIKN